MRRQGWEDLQDLWVLVIGSGLSGAIRSGLDGLLIHGPSTPPLSVSI